MTKLAAGGAEAWIGSQKTVNAPDLIVVDSVPDGLLSSDAWSSMLASRPVWYVRSGYAGEEVRGASGDMEVSDHPVTRYLKFQDTHVASVWQPKGMAWAKPIVSAGGVPLLYAGTENGQPRLLLAFALQQSDLPLRAEFPVFVQNALAWLTAAHGGSLGRAIAGERKEIAMSPGAATAVWVQANNGQPVGEAEKASGRLSSLQTMPALPGLYRFEERDDAGRPVQSRWLGVVADARESAPAAAEPDFSKAFRPGPPDGQDGEVQQSGADGQTAQSVVAGDKPGAPYALWRWLVVLVIAAVVWEWGVYRRGHSV